MKIAIGSWVCREKRGVLHLVESIVAGDVVTRCGRRLSDEPTTRGPLARFASNDVLVAQLLRPLCRQCEA